MPPQKFDDIDIKILKLLQKDGRITNAQLSKEIGLSPAPTLERVRKLEQSGIIDSYHAKLNKEKIGIGVSTFLMVSMKGHNTENMTEFINGISDIEEITECHHITGSGDFILKVVSRDINSYQKLLLEKVTDIPVVDNLQSIVILSTFKETGELPIQDL